MKNKAKRDSEKNANAAHALPVEEYARLVEGLDAADVEAACVDDGAAPGGVPPAWNSAAFSERLAKRLLSSHANAPAPEAAWDVRRDGPGGLSGVQVPCVVIAHGRELSALGIEDGDALDVHEDATPREGDLVIADLVGLGRVLRRLRFVSGAALLCSQHPERPAISLNERDVALVKVVTPRVQRP